MEDKLLNLHQVLHSAQIENFHDKEEVYDKVHNFRVRTKDYENATKICERHGITLSIYLRKCMETLVKEYTE